MGPENPPRPQEVHLPLSGFSAHPLTPCCFNQILYSFLAELCSTGHSQLPAHPGPSLRCYFLFVEHVRLSDMAMTHSHESVHLKFPNILSSLSKSHTFPLVSMLLELSLHQKSPSVLESQTLPPWCPSSPPYTEAVITVSLMAIWYYVGEEAISKGLIKIE